MQKVKEKRKYLKIKFKRKKELQKTISKIMNPKMADYNIT